MLDIGDPAPLFSGEDLRTGETFSLADHKGKIILIAFLGLGYDGWSRDMGPVLQKLWEESQESMVIPSTQIVLISVADDPTALAEFLENNGITIPIVDSYGIYPQYDTEQVPTLYVVNPDMKICNAVEWGHCPDENLEQELRDFILACRINMVWPPVNPVHWLAVMRILFGVTQDGGGLGVTPGGTPKPIDPWDPLRRMAVEKRDLLIELAIGELAGQLKDVKARRDLESRALEGVGTAVKNLVEKSKRKPISLTKERSSAPKSRKKER
jgi:hypothetical protein